MHGIHGVVGYLFILKTPVLYSYHELVSTCMGTTFFSHRQIVILATFLCSCSLFLKILQLLLLLPLTVVCSSALSIITRVFMAP